MYDLDGIVELITSGRSDAAERGLREILDAVGDDRRPRAIETLIFGSALARRLSADVLEEANLYLASYDVPQIRLFNLLVRHVPTVSLASEVANALLVRACSEHPRPILIDIGIGTGRQVVTVLELLAASERPPETITVVGIEPAKLALDVAARQIEAAAAKLGLSVQFVPLLGSVETLSNATWNELARDYSGAVVNASFSLHHIADVDGKDARTHVLSRLRALAPSLIVLSEPNADHREPDFRRRYENCRRHFGATFRVIDAQAIGADDRDSLKVFFGREIADIIGNPDDQRSERHESTTSWASRLADSGYAPVAGASLPRVGSRGGVDVVANNGFIGLEYEGELMVSVLCSTGR